MNILLMRHGDALQKAIDESRPLSEVGIRQVKRVCQFLDLQSVEIQSICHSEKTRAQQTAEIVGKHINKTEILRYVRSLDPNKGTQIFLDDLFDYQESTLFVGHLPNIQIFVQALLESSMQAVPPISFEPGAIIILNREGNEQWKIVSQFSPDEPEF